MKTTAHDTKHAQEVHHTYCADQMPDQGAWVRVRTPRKTYTGRFLWCNVQHDGITRVGLKDGAGWWVIDLDEIVGMGVTTKEIATRHYRVPEAGGASRASQRKPMLAFGG